MKLTRLKRQKHHKQLEFKPGDLVWIHLRNERFRLRRKNKLMARGDGPFEIIEKVGSNAYKLQLLRTGLFQPRSTLEIKALMRRIPWKTLWI